MTTTTTGAATTAASLDVGEIDQYLLHLLVPRFRSMLKHLGVVPLMGTESPVLHAMLLWIMMAETPGSLALGLKTRRNSEQRVLGYIGLAVVLPTLYRLLEDHHRRLQTEEQQQQQSTSSSSSTMERRARDRRQRLAKTVIDNIQRILPVARVVVLLSWWAGKVPAPTLSMCATGLSYNNYSQQQQQLPRDLNVSYAHRRWTYEALLRALQLTSPIQSFQDITDLVTHVSKPVTQLVVRLLRGRPTHNDRCAVCQTKPVVVPYLSNCNHLYCYTCLWNATTRHRADFKCPQCSQTVTSSKRAAW